MIDPVSLRVLLAVHDTGSVTRAARLLGYSAPNLTQHLRKLERALKAPMVVRAGRGVVLTPEALAVLEPARAIVEGLEALPLLARQEAEPSGTFRIAAFPTSLRGIVLPAMAVARERYPRLEIVPTEIEPGPGLDLLRNGRLDVVLSKALGPIDHTGRDPDHLRIRIGLDPLDAVVPAQHLLARRDTISLPELARERLALTPNEDLYGPWIASHSPDLLGAVERAYEAVELASLVRFVELGLAVTVLPRMGRPHLSESVVAVPLADDDAFRTIEVLVRPIAARARTVTAVVELLRDALTGE